MTPAAKTRLVRLSAGALLLAQARTKKLIRQATASHVAEAAAEAERRKADRRNRAALLLLLLSVGKRMSASVADAITRGRQQARIAAAKRLGAELGEAGVDVQPTVLTVTADVDSAAAAISADSLASQWRGKALASAVIAERKGESPYRVMGRSIDLLGPAIDRTAETESAQAFTEEHRELLRQMAKQYDIDETLLERKWSSMLDACPLCKPHDGERTGLYEPFSDGAEPGDMHPRCRCIDVVVPAEGVRSKAA